MVKRGVIFLVLILSIVILFVGIVSASFSIGSDTIKKDYSLTEILSGKLNLSVTSENANSVVTILLANKSFARTLANISLASLVANLSYTCTPVDCKDGFSRSGTSATSKTITISGDSKYFGFIINGANVTVSKIEFGVSPSFNAGYTIPLGFEFFGGSNFRYNKLSGIYYSDENLGCFRGKNSEFVVFPGPDEQYCERISLPQTTSLKIGAKISGYDPDDENKITMSVYKEGNFNFDDVLIDCKFDPKTSDSCIVNSLDFLEPGIFEGDYYICAQTPSEQYQILVESEDENCGGTLTGIKNGEMDDDFAIFARVAQYAKAQNFTITSSSQVHTNYENLQYLVEEANNYLQEKYNGNCVDGCILPIKVYGTNQNLKISKVDVKYTDKVGGRPKTLNLVSSLINQPSKISFSGDVPLESLEIKLIYAGIKNLTFNYNGIKKLSKEITVKPAPIINAVYPTNPPVSSPVRFFASVDSGNRAISSYKWEFGDGTTETTGVNNVVHTYSDMKAYTLKLTATDSLGLSGTGEFELIPGSPSLVINSTLKTAKENINRVQTKINGFAEIYKKSLTDLLKLDEKSAELIKIEKNVKEATLDEEFFKALTDINNLEIPYDIAVDTEKTKIVPDKEEINPAIVTEVSGEAMDENEISAYQEGIVLWEQNNIESSMEIKRIYSILETGRKPLMNIYSLSLSSEFSGDNYIVLEENFDNVNFRTDGDLHFGKSLDSTYGILDGEKNSSVSLEFFTKQENLSRIGDMIIFVSPELKELNFENIKIDNCNYNNVCEKDLGENPTNCERDCFPYLKFFLYCLIVLFICFVIYSAAAVWYKLHYERYLFKDRRNLFNIVSFIENARNKKVKEDDIKESLAKKGWGSEQIVYALKKQKGERTGMLELIPFSRLFDIKVKNQIIIPSNTTIVIKK